MFADLVFRNGQVITVDEKDSIDSSIAVRENRIVYVGDEESILKWIGPETSVVDLNGRSLLPGFIDSHLHLALHGVNKLSADCKHDVHSISDIQERIRKLAAITPKGRWVRGWGYNDSKLSENRHPTRWDLDKVSVEHPIILVRTCSHISVCNSKALELAGIDDSTPNPEGGEIVRGADGIPTGVLKEAAHMRTYQLAKFSAEEIMKGMILADKDFHEAGITTIHDAGGFGALTIRLMQKAVQERKILSRIYTMWSPINDSEQFVTDMLKTGIFTGLGDDRFKIGPAKLFLDGSSSGPTCATREPYTSMPEYNGIQYYTEEEIDNILGKAHELGWQITAHAIGDKAVEMMLNCIERALDKFPRENHRHRIEHAGMVPPDLLERIKKLGIVPIPNPVFFYEFGDGYLKNYGEERVSYMFPAGSYVRNDILAAAGSDCPITTCNPLLGIATAVLRRTESGQSVGQNESVSILEAIRMYTYNGAFASFDEAKKGSLEVGKFADLVVLNGSILDTEPEKIPNIKVDMTVIDGEIVYKRSMKPTTSIK